MSEPLNDGGPAFPCDTKAFQPHTGVQVTAQQFYGMSLRDWFAGQALAGLMTEGFIPNMVFPPGNTREFNYAVVAYEMADAMLKAREASHD